VLSLFALLAPLTTSVLAQPSDEESTEEATILLMPYLFRPADAPAGYVLSTTEAYPNEAEAFEAVMFPPPDPRGMDALLTMFTQSGRIVRLNQGFESDDDDSAPALAFKVAAFKDASSAGRALQDPGLLMFMAPGATVTAVTAPTFGTGIDAVAAQTVDQTFDEDTGVERSVVLSWQRGRLVFSVVASGPPDEVATALPMLVDLATRADTRIASQPAFPATIARGPEYLPSTAQRLMRYKDLVPRLPDDEAFGEDMHSTGISAIPNALIVLDSQIADAPVNDARFVQNRLHTTEKRLLGVSKRFEPADSDEDDPATTFPAVTVGYHLYADQNGAREAVGSSAAEIALRMNEEVYILNDPKQQAVTDTTSAMTVGDQTRTMTGRANLDDDTELQITTVRWRRGAVELFANVVVPAGTDSAPLVSKAVQSLDAALTSMPMAGS
jgi:hypothetical protein